MHFICNCLSPCFCLLISLLILPWYCRLVFLNIGTTNILSRLVPCRIFSSNLGLYPHMPVAHPPSCGSQSCPQMLSRVLCGVKIARLRTSADKALTPCLILNFSLPRPLTPCSIGNNRSFVHVKENYEIIMEPAFPRAWKTLSL